MANNGRHLLLVLIFAAAAAAIFAGQWTGESEVPPQPQHAPRLTEVRIGHFANITHAQALIARADADFERRLEAKAAWFTFNAGPAVIEAMYAGALDLAYIGPNPAVNGFIRSGGRALRIIAGSASGGAALVVRGDYEPGLRLDFANAVIATPQLGNTQDVAARKWFKQQGLLPREHGGTLTIIPIANYELSLLMKKGEIDGAWTIEPWVSTLEREAGAKVVLDEAELWPGGRYPTTYLIAASSFVENHRETVRRFAALHADITAKLEQNKRQYTAMIGEELKRLSGKEIPPEVLRRAVERIRFSDDLMAEELNECVRAAIEIGYLPETAVIDGIFGAAVLEKPEKEPNRGNNERH